MQTVTPFLWFNGRLDEATKFYTSIFKKSKVSNVAHGPKGKIMCATIKINGQEFMAFDGGPHFKFTPAFSFFIECKTQKEVDYYWEKLSKGGKKQMCGWLQDKFGLSWQVVPTALGKFLSDSDAAKSGRALNAMLKMKKIDIKGLDRAFNKG